MSFASFMKSMGLWKSPKGPTGSGASANIPPKPSEPSSTEADAILAEAGPVSGEQAVKLILSGRAPDNLQATGPVLFRSKQKIVLPTGFTAPSITCVGDVLDSLPDFLSARRISVLGSSLKHIGRGLKCRSLDLEMTGIESLPDDIEASDRINLSRCLRLRRLPQGLSTGSLVLTGCTGLAELPEGLDVAFLELSDCTSLRRLPDDLSIRGGRLSIRNCPWLTRLPDGLGEISELDVSGCLNLTSLPETLTVTSWIDIAGSGITSLPERMKNVGLRWRGITVSHRMVFEPHLLDPRDVLNEQNAELRRVMIERIGYERLLSATNAEEVDRDQDAGGERRLLRIPVGGDEPVVCVAVKCPSTGHQFFLRVPPQMRSCREAVAWTAGYDDPDQYRPAYET